MEVLILDDLQLRKLIYMVYGTEIGVIDTIGFRDGDEAREQREDCYFSYKTVEDFLDIDCAKLQSMFSKDDVRAQIAQNISSYLICCANSAFMMLRNYSVRKTYLEKVRDHADSIILELKELDPSDTEDLEHLSKRAEMYYRTEMEYLRMFQSGASESFSQWLKDQGWTFEELLNTYKAQLGFGASFADLEEGEKLQVYELIIQVSGRGKVTFNKSLLIKTHKPLREHDMQSESGHFHGARADIKWKDVKGTASLIYKAGKVVWDLYTAENKVEAGIRLAVDAAASKAGVTIAVMIEAAIATGLLVGVTESSIFVFTTGVLTGFVGPVVGAVAGFIISAIAGKVLDMIFESGGKVSIPYERHSCYVMELPNGMELARQIAYLKD